MGAQWSSPSLQNADALIFGIPARSRRTHSIKTQTAPTMLKPHDICFMSYNKQIYGIGIYDLSHTRVISYLHIQIFS